MLVESLRKQSIPDKPNVISIQPELSKWPDLLVENKKAAEAIPQRSRTCAEILKTARDYTSNVLEIPCKAERTGSIIATGHQAIWHHCGIWVKTLIACKFARASGNKCLHLVLDHDVCDTAIVLPHQNCSGGWRFRLVEIESEKSNAPLEMRQLSQKEQVQTFINTITEAYPWEFCNNIWSDLRFPDDKDMTRFGNVADLITFLQSILTVRLGFDDILYLPVSKLSESDSFVRFFISIAMDAVHFASIYSDGIDKHIDSSRLSLKRLKNDEQTGLTELPFWLISPDGVRTTLCVVSDKTNAVTMGDASNRLGVLDSMSSEGKVGQLRNLLKQTGCRLRPKAISLTMFVRMFLADWFVHGVGASRYEPVTDYIIEEYYGTKSPNYGTATCTMTLPLLGTQTYTDDEITQLKNKLHELKHNPEKYIDEEVLHKESVVSLIEIKKRQVRIACDKSVSREVRNSAWNSLFEINQKLSEYVRNISADLQKKITAFDKIKTSQEILNSRIYFFGLFPEEELYQIAAALAFTECERFGS